LQMSNRMLGYQFGVGWLNESSDEDTDNVERARGKDEPLVACLGVAGNELLSIRRGATVRRLRKALQKKEGFAPDIWYDIFYGDEPMDDDEVLADVIPREEQNVVTCVKDEEGTRELQKITAGPFRVVDAILPGLPPRLRCDMNFMEALLKLRVDHEARTGGPEFGEALTDAQCWAFRERPRLQRLFCRCCSRAPRGAVQAFDATLDLHSAGEPLENTLGQSAFPPGAQPGARALGAGAGSSGASPSDSEEDAAADGIILVPLSEC
jgi:hypothetical protein